MIDAFFRQWDEDKYENQGTFLLNNYKQVIGILDRDVLALQDAKQKFNLTDADLDRWEKNEADFFATLGKEPTSKNNTLQVGYVELLQTLQAALVDRSNAECSSYYGRLQDSSFVAETPQSIQAGCGQMFHTMVSSINIRCLKLRALTLAINDGPNPFIVKSSNADAESYAPKKRLSAATLRHNTFILAFTTRLLTSRKRLENNAFARRRNAINKALLKRIRQIHGLVGLTGDPSRGVHLGSDNNEGPEVEDDSNTEPPASGIY